MQMTLAVSREVCRRMTQFHARTFYFASHTLPGEKRQDAYAVYAFCRYVDDQIDLAPTEEERRKAFVRLEDLLETVLASSELDPKILQELPWAMAFRETALRRKIPQLYFEDLLTGVEMDQGSVRIQTWDELDRYCYHVASVVGLIMTQVLTDPGPELLAPARDLGTAMQLTNILRDIAEDWQNNRIYIPAEELNRFGLTEEDIKQGRVNDSFRAMMRFQIGRARQYYASAQVGIAGLPRDGSQLTVQLMSTIYGAILREIELCDYNVYQGRVRVSLIKKLGLTAQVLLGKR